MKKIMDELKAMVERRNQSFVDSENIHIFNQNEVDCFKRKLKDLERRHCEIVKSTVNGRVASTQRMDDLVIISYILHYQHLIKQKKGFYLEEYIQERKAVFRNDELERDEEIMTRGQGMEETTQSDLPDERTDERFTYDRREAVKYAERWWNDYNPEFKKFEVNCTNYVSQCLYAGGAPMTGYPNRSKGWWFKNNNWSYSWSVAHAFRWYLSGAKSGLRGREMESARDLSLGDVICYDFDGDGKWQHTTIVVAKDENGEPLVNAQTTNSRMRYWKYEDSTAWTPDIKYKFFHIEDGQ